MAHGLTKRQVRQGLLKRLLPEANRYFTLTPTATSTTTVTYGQLVGLLQTGHLKGGSIRATVPAGTVETKRIASYVGSTGVATLVSGETFSNATLTNVEVLQAGLTFEQVDAAIEDAVTEATSFLMPDDSDFDMATMDGNEFNAPTGWRWLRQVEIEMPSSSTGGDRWVEQNRTSLSEQALNATSANGRLGQAILMQTEMLVKAVWVLVREIGTLGASTPTFAASLQTASSSLPSGTVATNGTSASVIESTADGEYRWLRLAFSSPVVLAPNVNYWLVLTPSGSADPSNYLTWRYDTAASYQGGTRATYDGASWTAASGVHLFRLEPARPEFRPLHPSAVRVNPAAARPISIMPRFQLPSGTLLRLHGYTAANELDEDDDECDIDPSLVQQYALGTLMSMQAANNETMLQTANYFKVAALDSWKKNATKVAGGSKQLVRQ